MTPPDPDFPADPPDDLPGVSAGGEPDPQTALGDSYAARTDHNADPADRSADPADRYDAPSGPYAAPPAPIRLFRSEELFAGGRVVCIEHAGSTYRLQITSRGKLILQK